MPSSQATFTTTGPCNPAAGPAIVFFTTSEPGRRNSAVAWTMVLNVAVCGQDQLLGADDPGLFPSHR